ncbi:dephospho-CoA kinase [Flagellimonas sp.]|uniref:dephospho-CoA kinase n=1 Tax=Flagellimonas sp. TaxID=2058762 RepID=UPI003F4A0443
MMKVGLTGGIGSGKSTVAGMFAELGVPVYDSDKEAKELMVNSETLKKDIITLLGDDAYQEGILNRGYIAKQVFENIHLLKKLNKIVHPAVREHFLKWANEQETNYVIQESALIFENGYEDFYDAIILVSAPLETRLGRVVKRDDSNEEEVIKRIENQLDDELKKKKAHFHLENIDLETTQKKVLEIHKALIESS